MWLSADNSVVFKTVLLLARFLWIWLLSRAVLKHLAFKLKYVNYDFEGKSKLRSLVACSGSYCASSSRFKEERGSDPMSSL